MIKRAPFTFCIGFVVLAVLIGGFEYQLVFKESLAHKDDAIKAKDDLIKTLQDKLSVKIPTPAPATTDKPQTGSATTHGDNSPATSGSIGKFNYNPPPTTKKKKPSEEK